MESKGNLAGMACVVTGGAQGIGRSIAYRLALAGGSVCIADRQEQLARQTAAELNAQVQQDVWTWPTDVTDPRSVTDLASAVLERHGRADVVVNNAGITRDNYTTKMPLEDFDLVHSVILRGSFIVTQAFLPAMMEQQTGCFLYIGSVSAHGSAGQANYASAKAGLVGLSNTVAKEHGRYGIRSVVVEPGYCRTGMLIPVPDRVLSEIERRTPLGRLAEPDDIARVVAFLVSPEAGFITNEVVTVSGGGAAL